MINTERLHHNHPSSLAAVVVIVNEMGAIAAGVENRTETSESVARSLHLDLRDLAERARSTIDEALARDACVALGKAYGLWFATGLLGRDRASRRFVRERMEDLVATIECDLEPEVLEMGCRRLLKEVAAINKEDLAEGDHISDLFLATAGAVALTQADVRTPHAS